MIGEWKDNKAHGIGKFWYANGDIYGGEWNENELNGKGRFLQKKDDAAFYKGKGGEKGSLKWSFFLGIKKEKETWRRKMLV